MGFGLTYIGFLLGTGRRILKVDSATEGIVVLLNIFYFLGSWGEVSTSSNVGRSDIYPTYLSALYDGLLVIDASSTTRRLGYGKMVVSKPTSHQRPSDHGSTYKQGRGCSGRHDPCWSCVRRACRSRRQPYWCDVGAILACGRIDFFVNN